MKMHKEIKTARAANGEGGLDSETTGIHCAVDDLALVSEAARVSPAASTSSGCSRRGPAG